MADQAYPFELGFGEELFGFLFKLRSSLASNNALGDKPSTVTPFTHDPYGARTFAWMWHSFLISSMSASVV